MIFEVCEVLLKLLFFLFGYGNCIDFAGNTVLSEGRHEKVRIFKFRRRKHSMKSAGHRQNYTELKIDEISA